MAGGSVGATLDRPHVWRPGAAGPPLLLLHGTGADEHSLVTLGDSLAPRAPMLAPRGTVLEDGALLRFFRRIREGVIDEDDLRIRADELADFLEAAGARYGVGPGSWVAVGYSNGANMASALLVLHPRLFAGAVLLAGMPPFRDGFGDVDLTGRRIAVAYGLGDTISPPELSRSLARRLHRHGAEVVELAHDGGHEISPTLLPALRSFLTASG